MAEAVSDLRMLLQHSTLSANQQSVIDIAVLYFASEDKSLHIAAHLLLSGAGSCVPLTPKLMNELKLLVNTKGLIHNLLCVLEAQLAPDSPVAPVILCCVSKLSALANPAVSYGLWSHRSDVQLLLAAACTSTDAAAAAAALAVAAAKRGLPARALLQDILPQANCSEEMQYNPAVLSPTAQTWAEVAMTPMLQQLQQEVCSWQGEIACCDSTPHAPAAAVAVRHSEVWLLLCCCINAAAAAHYTPVAPVEQLFRQPAVTAAMQAALTSNSSEQAYKATVQLIGQVSALSPTLARCCFTAVAPVIVQLLQQQTNSSKASSSADDGWGDQPPEHRAASSAAGAMWHRLLLRMRGNFCADIETFMLQQLPLVAAGIGQHWNNSPSEAAAHSTVACGTVEEATAGSSSCGRSSSALTARITAFFAAARSVTPCTQPLLQRHPDVVIAAVAPHVGALVQVIKQTSHGSASVSPSVRQQQQDQVLAFWLLQSLIYALQNQQLDHQQQQPEGMWSGIIGAVAELMTISETAADAHLQAAGLQLARGLLRWHIRMTSDTPSAAVAPLAEEGPSAAVAGLDPVVLAQWHRLLIALVRPFRQSRVTPRELSKRHLLLVGCRLLGALAEWLQKQYTAAQQATPAASAAKSSTEHTVLGAVSSHSLVATASTSTSCQSSSASGSAAESVYSSANNIDELINESCSHLRALSRDLSCRRLERSSSGQDLVDAIDDVLSMLGHSQLYVNLMLRRSGDNSVCMHVRIL